MLLCAILCTFVCLSARAQSGEIRREAEAAVLSNCEITSASYYSGRRAVKMASAKAQLEFMISVPTRMKYKVYVCGEGLGGEKVVGCVANDVKSSFRLGTYAEVEAGICILDEGNNTLVVKPEWTWFAVDYVRLVPYAQTDIPFAISPMPVTPNPSPSARRLYTFLRDNFGRATISGMMTGSMDGSAGTNIRTHEDVEAIHAASGRYPALVGFDFMNATGVETDNDNPWYRAYTRKVLSLAVDVWREGGIPDFCWHWRDPSRGSSAFYTKEAKARITDAMHADGSWDTSSRLYRQIIKDIDAVADHLLTLQEAGVACIFRPLHEAPGGWFWWGASGADAYRKLYRLVYDEMVGVKGVRNVVWDWNADYTRDMTWCPGEDVYDVATTDIYNEAGDYSSNFPAFDRLRELTRGRKLIALAENGPIPDIDREEADGAMWMWWMPWYQSWNGRFADRTSAEEWTKCMADPRVLTLDAMPGWGE